jgi:hypothetical protein
MWSRKHKADGFWHLINDKHLLKRPKRLWNSSPLVQDGDDVNLNIALISSHFLTLNPSIGIPESHIDEKDTDCIANYISSDRLMNIWKTGPKLLNMFWVIWRNDYLLNFRERTQSKIKTGRVFSQIETCVGKKYC